MIATKGCATKFKKHLLIPVCWTLYSYYSVEGCMVEQWLAPSPHSEKAPVQIQNWNFLWEVCMFSSLNCPSVWLHDPATGWQPSPTVARLGSGRPGTTKGVQRVKKMDGWIVLLSINSKRNIWILLADFKNCFIYYFCQIQNNYFINKSLYKITEE